MKSVSFASAAVLAVSLGTVVPVGTAEALVAEEPTASALTPAAQLSLGTQDIRAHIRRAERTTMSARDRRCRSYVAARMPKWWSSSGHTVICRSGKTRGYDFWFDGIVLTVNSALSSDGWRQGARWAPPKVPAVERLPLSSAPALCRKAVNANAALVRASGYKVRCVSKIDWKVPNARTKNLTLVGLTDYRARTISILELRDVGQMGHTLAHEVGHAISMTPKTAGLRRDVTRFAKRRSFTAGPYEGMPAEIWAESFARYWTGRRPATVQRRLISEKSVAALLRKYHLPRR